MPFSNHFSLQLKLTLAFGMHINTSGKVKNREVAARIERYTNGH